jgi:DNA-binding NtrC family response regulator
MKNHRGSIRVESHLGIGSTFTLYLPEKTAASGSTVYHLHHDQNQAEGKKVLIVDDDAVVLEVTSKMFQRMGFETVKVSDGDSALEAFEESRGEIQLVFLDIQIPGIGGAELSSRFLEMDPEVRVVVNSGYDEEVATAEILGRERLAGFIQKPYTATDLERLVQNLEAHA